MLFSAAKFLAQTVLWGTERTLPGGLVMLGGAPFLPPHALRTTKCGSSKTSPITVPIPFCYLYLLSIVCLERPRKVMLAQTLYRSTPRCLLTGSFSRFTSRTTAVYPKWNSRLHISSSSRNTLPPLSRLPFGIELCGRVAGLFNRKGVENLLWGSHLMAAHGAPMILQVSAHSPNALHQLSMHT